MKQLKILVILLVLGQFVFGQERPIQKDDLLFQKGLLLQELLDYDLELDRVINSKDSNKVKKEFATEIKETILLKALEFYKELIDSFPNSKLLFRTLNNKGFIELALADKTNAKKTFQIILEGKVDDKEKGGIGMGIMAEPYANYKNRASKVLADIYIKDSNYIEAIKYLDLTEKYPYRHFCGNEYAAEKIYRSELYAKCYIGLNDRKKALDYLLPNLIENGLAKNSDLVLLTYKTLLQDYKNEEIKYKFEKAFKNIQSEKVKTNTSEYERKFITFMNVKIEVDVDVLEWLRTDKSLKKNDNLFNATQFYELLSGQKYSTQQ